MLSYGDKQQLGSKQGKAQQLGHDSSSSKSIIGQLMSFRMIQHTWSKKLRRMQSLLATLYFCRTPRKFKVDK